MRRSLGLVAATGVVIAISMMVARSAWCDGPGLTTIADTVYRADGAPATGTVLISWPAFISAEGNVVAAGKKSVGISGGGAFTTSLVSNVNSNPAGTYYSVVFQLDDGTVRSEYWAVGTTSPTNIAAIRTTPGTGVAAGLVSKQYVDAAVATRASDASVVHLSGSEMIQGAKQFAAAPMIPAPAGAEEAANKAYVDAAVANVGAGNFVAKAGDTMTGPLTLAGDPSAPNQAANRHYVDTGLTGKASLLNGVVPTNQLGSGAADGSMCLKGSSSWGSCGTSSDAVSIRGITVAAIAPTDGQVITYEAGTNSYKPKAGGGATSVYQATKYAADFQFTLTPSTDLSTPGAKTVTISACPAGVRGDEADYWVYIAETGTAEAVLVTGGTCAGDGNSGTLQFTTVNGHTAGYTIGSASAGIAEASIAARYRPRGNGGYSGGKIIAPMGDISIYGQLTIKSSAQTIEFTGGSQACYSATTACVYIGDKNNSNAVTNVTLINMRGRAKVAGGMQPMVEVNAQHTTIRNLMGLYDPPGTFGYWVKVDDDQAFVLDGLDTTSAAGGPGVLRCDSTFCGSYVYNAADFAHAPAVGWLKHLNLNIQCNGNGVDWGGGNTLHISDSVIEGYSQFAVRGGLTGGGYGKIQLTNVYFEDTGVCTNPVDGSQPSSTGASGVLVRGGLVSIEGGEGPGGHLPVFANTGSTMFHYYVVPRHATYGYGNPLIAGLANTNGTGNITVKWPDIAGAASFDILKIQYGQGPYGFDMAVNGTGNYAVATNVTRAAACAGGICSITDTQAPPSSYTVNVPTYYPKLDLWPGALVLAASADSGSPLQSATADMRDMAWQTPIGGLNTVMGAAGTAVSAERCPLLTHRSAAWVTCATPSFPLSTGIQEAMLLHNGYVPGVSGLKGRLNFGPGNAIGEVITLSDANFGRTLAASVWRPANDPNDAYIGYDQGNGVSGIGVSFGAPLSISSYIGSVSDGTSWKERLTGTLKEFKTDVRVGGNLTVTGTCTGCVSNAITGDFTVSGKVTADSFASTGTGPWSVEGGYGTLTPAAAGKSKVGFGANGKLSVSENGGAVTELEKKVPQQFTYTFFDANNLLTTALQVPSIYVNRAAAFHILEVYCEIDGGTATINLQSGGANILSSDLACTTAGATTSSFVAGKDAVAVGTKIGHVTATASGTLHRVNVVVKYIED